jgi:transposase
MEGARGHVGGERAAAFRSLVRILDPERVLLVGIGVAKASWFALGSTLDGDIVLDGVKLPADARGLAKLQQLIACAREECRAQLVLIGIEAAGHYHQTLAAHLNEQHDVVLRLVNPAAVAAVRKSQLNRRRKTDRLDAAAICELLDAWRRLPLPAGGYSGGGAAPLVERA